MKRILILSLFLLSSIISARNYTIPETKVKNLENYKNLYMTRYLVFATKGLGQYFSINTVYKVGETMPIEYNEVTFKSQSFKQTWGGFKNPNRIVYVIHPGPEHALNALGLANDPFVISRSPFRAPDYIAPAEETKVTDKNKKFIIRRFHRPKTTQISF